MSESKASPVSAAHTPPGYYPPRVYVNGCCVFVSYMDQDGNEHDRLHSECETIPAARLRAEALSSGLSQHTRTPWHIEPATHHDERRFNIVAITKNRRGNDLSLRIAEVLHLDGFRDGGFIDGDGETKANAAYIVQAVNSFDKLVAVVAKSRKELDYLSNGPRGLALLQEMDAALALAEGAVQA